MNRNLKGLISVVMLYGLAVTNANAALLLYGALSSGGDTLASASGDGGDYDLKAGGLFHFAMGYDGKVAPDVGMRITYGYKFDSLDADNGDVEITRFPLEAVFYKTFSERHNLGGGLVYEMSPQYEESIDGYGSLDIDFDDATGYMLYYGYSINNLEWGLRYTDIQYEYEDSFLAFDIDGSSYGVYMSLSFQ